MVKCKICNNELGNRSYTAHEMMFGLGDDFAYTECGNCGCVQIDEIPEDLSKYYPEHYYSFNTRLRLTDNPIVAFLKKQRASHVFENSSLIGKIFWNTAKRPVFYVYFQRAGIDLSSSVLDVGCGEGKLLVWMKREGFTDLTGVDPYLKDPIDYGNGLIIYKKDLSEIDREFDFIMLHHSFEHMGDPLAVLQKLVQLLKKDGCLLIRIPVASSYAWKTFGIHWMALDPPRHLFLHTEESMKILAEQAGLKTSEVIYDSAAQQFWGSIQYQKGISLVDDRSYYKNKEKSIFTPEEIKKFEKHAKELNEKRTGDTACFYLKKA